MSQENVEIVRRIYDAVARRDDMTPFEFYARDIVWDLSNSSRAALSSQPVYRGHDGVRQAGREALAAFGEVDFEVVEVLDDAEHVIAIIREREVGRASRVPVEATHTAVWTLAYGKVTRLRVFDDRKAALQAVGLRE
jgi:ketosteroid isomerase-like protein